MLDHMSTLAQIEREHILHRLYRFNGNLTQTAVSLDIGLRTLQRKLRLYGLTNEGWVRGMPPSIRRETIMQFIKGEII